MTDYTKIEQEVDNVADLIWDLASHVWDFAELFTSPRPSSAKSQTWEAKSQMTSATLSTCCSIFV